MASDALLAIVELLDFRCTAADVALKSGDDVAACRRKLLALGSQVRFARTKILTSELSGILLSFELPLLVSMSCFSFSKP